MFWYVSSVPALNQSNHESDSILRMIPGIRVCVRAPDSAARDDRGAGWGDERKERPHLAQDLRLPGSLCACLHVPLLPSSPGRGVSCPKQMLPKSVQAWDRQAGGGCGL